MNATSSRPLYWPLQEFIYANGEMEQPIRWAAQRVRDGKPEFGADDARSTSPARPCSRGCSNRSLRYARSGRPWTCSWKTRTSA